MSCQVWSEETVSLFVRVKNTFPTGPNAKSSAEAGSASLRFSTYPRGCFRVASCSAPARVSQTTPGLLTG